jgi:hypothetical protein
MKNRLAAVRAIGNLVTADNFRFQARQARDENDVVGMHLYYKLAKSFLRNARYNWKLSGI